MPVIHPTTIPPALPESLSRTIKTKDAAALLPALIGEMLEARGGEKAAPANAPYAGFMKLFLSNPDVLLEIFQKGPEIFQQQSLNQLLPETARQALGNVTKLIESLVYSPQSSTNPLFLKDYAARLGLALESNWRQALQQGQDGRRPAESLKSVLLKLSGELTDFLQKNAALPPEELRKLTELVKFTETSLRTIETQQVLNVYTQENDGKYLLQLPLLFPGSVRTGEIFIELGKNGAGGKEKKKKCHVVMFLNMDRLGDIMVDASLSENAITGVFKFTDPEAQAFFAPFLAELGDALRGLGYDNASLTSHVAEDVRGTRQDYRRELMPEQDAINLFA